MFQFKIVRESKSAQVSCVFERKVGFREREAETGWSFDGRVEKKEGKKGGEKHIWEENRKKKKKSFLTENKVLTLCLLKRCKKDGSYDDHWIPIHCVWYVLQRR